MMVKTELSSSILSVSILRLSKNDFKHIPRTIFHFFVSRLTVKIVPVHGTFIYTSVVSTDFRKDKSNVQQMHCKNEINTDQLLYPCTSEVSLVHNVPDKLHFICSAVFCIFLFAAQI